MPGPFCSSQIYKLLLSAQRLKSIEARWCLLHGQVSPSVTSGLFPFVEYIYLAPGRCTGTKKLPLIPNDVYFEIFDHIQPSDEIAVAEHKHVSSNLTLVCCFFCAVLLPRIFKSLKFSGHPHKKSDTPGYALFCRALIRGKEPARSLALHVKECTFSQWTTCEDHLESVFNGFLGLYNQAITHQENHKLLTALICLRTVLTSLIIIWYLISVLKHLAQSGSHFL